MLRENVILKLTTDKPFFKIKIKTLEKKKLIKKPESLPKSGKGASKKYT